MHKRKYNFLQVKLKATLEKGAGETTNGCSFYVVVITMALAILMLAHGISPTYYY